MKYLLYDLYEELAVMASWKSWRANNWCSAIAPWPKRMWYRHVMCRRRR